MLRFLTSKAECVSDSSRRKDEAGAALVETAICFPLVLVLLIGLIEAGRYFDRLYSVSRIAYEGARYGARLVGLEHGNNVGAITTASGVIAPSVQNQVRTKLAELLVPLVLPWTKDIHGNLHIEQAQDKAKQLSMLADISVDRADQTVAGVVTAYSSNKVSVSVNVPFDPLIFPNTRIFPVKNVHATATAPYLFVRENKPAFVTTP